MSWCQVLAFEIKIKKFHVRVLMQVTPLPPADQMGS